jgi:hypothetical protein
VLSCRIPLEDQTSGIETWTPASLPERITTSPFPRMVLLGYQRPNCIGADRFQLLELYEKMDMSGKPLPVLRCPPVTTTRPSPRRVWPAQKSHTGLGTSVKLRV